MERLLILIAALFIFSCKPEYIRRYDKVEGTWELEKMEFVDESGQKQQITQPYLLQFSGYPALDGLLRKDAATFRMQYNFGKETCDLMVELQRQLTGAMIGKVQVYQYTLKGNTLTFLTDKEFDYPASKLLKNVSYTFQKK